MGGWLDRWAKRAAEAAPRAAQDELSPSPAAPTPSRRDFLKKAGVVGGVAWSVPVLQTVMAPAASASIGTPLGGTCGDTGPCANGNANCNGLTCGGVGAACTSLCDTGLVCSSRPGNGATCGGPGAACLTNADCTYQNCFNNVCGSAGASCSTKVGCTGSLNCIGSPKTCG